MTARHSFALLGATYGVLGYLLGKLGVGLAILAWIHLSGGNPWAVLLLVPVAMSVGLVWMSARGLAVALARVSLR